MYNKKYCNTECCNSIKRVVEYILLILPLPLPPDANLMSTHPASPFTHLPPAQYVLPTHCTCLPLYVLPSMLTSYLPPSTCHQRHHCFSHAALFLLHSESWNLTLVAGPKQLPQPPCRALSLPRSTQCTSSHSSEWLLLLATSMSINKSSPASIQDNAKELVQQVSAWTGPPWTGWIETTQDVLLIIKAAHCGIIPHVMCWFLDSERRMITSGSVFMFDGNESSMGWWMDGFSWSPSRFLGNFLVSGSDDVWMRGPTHSKTHEIPLTMGEGTRYAWCHKI